MALLVTWRAGVAAAFMHGLLVTQCLAAGPGRGGRGSHKGGLRLPRGGAQSRGLLPCPPGRVFSLLSKQHGEAAPAPGTTSRDLLGSQGCQGQVSLLAA